MSVQRFHQDKEILIRTGFEMNDCNQAHATVAIAYNKCIYSEDKTDERCSMLMYDNITDKGRYLGLLLR